MKFSLKGASVLQYSRCITLPPEKRTSQQVPEGVFHNNALRATGAIQEQPQLSQNHIRSITPDTSDEGTQAVLLPSEVWQLQHVLAELEEGWEVLGLFAHRDAQSCP